MSEVVMAKDNRPVGAVSMNHYRTNMSKGPGSHYPPEHGALAYVFYLMLSVLSSVGYAHGQNVPGHAMGELGVAIRMSDSRHVITDHARIDKKKMDDAIGIVILVDGSETDLNLKVVAFVLSSMVNGSLIEAVSMDENFTPEQKKIIRAARKDSKIYMEHIRVVDPLGRVYSVPSKVMVVG